MNGAPLPMRLAILGLPLLLPAFSYVMPGFWLTFWPALALPAVAVAAWELAGPGVVGLIALVAASPEMHVGSSPSTIIALHKAATMALVGIIIVRRGFSGQFNGPAFAFLASFVLTPTFGSLFPLLSPSEMVRSLVGSIAPFALVWARTERRWHEPMVLVAAAAPLLCLAAGLALSVTGHRLFGFDQNNVLRIQGASIPAFLGYFGEIGTFAAFGEYARTGRMRWLALTAGAYLSIVASGTRVPMATAGIYCLLVLVFARGPNFGVTPRLRLWVLGSCAAVAMALLVGPTLVARTFRSATGASVNFSGRDVIWPIFVDAVARHPLFGQGIGTGRFLAPEDAVRYIGSNAAHNEYLRLSVDMGIVGVVMVVLGHAAWFRQQWGILTQVERTVLLAFSFAFALHCISDNTLISAPAMILYAWLATFIERARRRAEDEGRLRPRRAPLARSAVPRV